MLDREQLETFATVIEEQSFERAATVLNVTRGAVSQRVQALEESLATILVVRDRPVAHTAAGEVLLRHVKALRLLESATLVELGPQYTRRALVPVTIAVNADSLATWFPGVLWPLMHSRRFAVELMADDQEHTLQRLARGEAMGCLSTQEKVASGFVAEPLGAMEYRCYATPDFAHEYFSKGFTVSSVIDAPAILFNRKNSLHDDFLMRVFGFRVDRYARHCVPSSHTLLDAILASVGYGLAPCVQARGFVEDGELIDLSPAKPTLVSLYWHHWAVEPTLSQEITKCVVEGARHVLLDLQNHPAI
jgi:LysR family transcriptional regulator (chromosome initiation inhibitor)